jgi:hypothetical protein
MVQQVAFYQLPVWVRLAAVLTLFNTWVLVAEFVIDRYGLDEHLPFYRYGDICLWDIGVIVALTVVFVKASRAGAKPSQTPAPTVMRKQYFFRDSPRGLLAWDVDRLVTLSARLPRCRVPLSHIRELDEPWSGLDDPPSWRSLVAHVRLMDDADLAFPIILASDGTVMDGMHRVAKALRLGLEDVEAVRSPEDPPPEHVDRGPGDLPYTRTG